MKTSILLLSAMLAAGLSGCGGNGDDGQDVETDDAVTPDQEDPDVSVDEGTDAPPDMGPDPDAPMDVPPDGSWTPPAGIPMPEFCIFETVEDSCAGCTVLSDPSLDEIADLAAGTVVVLTGGPHTGGEITVGGSGTADRPIFIRGADASSRPVISRTTGIRGSYVIVENIDFDFAGGDSGVGIEGDHVCLRHSEVHHIDPGHNSTTVFVSNSENVVIYDNYIHDNGDFEYVGEQDVHGIGAVTSHRLWVVDNVMHHNRGDSIQFGHQAGNTLGDFYVGRNDLHSDGENCVDIKEASNVVISQNILHNPAEGMPAVVLHDCPLNAAAIFNEVFDADVGINSASLEAACDPHVPITIFILRNTIHDVTDTGVQAWGSGKLYYATGNTFTSVPTPVEIDPAEAGSVISEGDDGLAEAYDAFFAVYGVDISGL